MSEKRTLFGSSASVGAALVALGVLVLVFNLLSLNLGPLIVTAVGIGIFVLMVLLGRKSGWLAVPAAVVTMVGLLLIYTNLFNHDRSWAYTWTLLFGAAGMGILISHYWSGRPQSTRFGTFLVQASLIAFVGFGLFFEVLIFSRGLFGKLLWPAILILLGGYLVLRARNGDLPANGKPRIARSKSKKGETEFEPLKVEEGSKAKSKTKSEAKAKT